MKWLLFAMPFLAVAVPVLWALQQSDRTVKTVKPVPKSVADTPAVKSDKARPPIDVDAPSKVETATFALG
jgi:hypothetical protein